MSNRFKPLIVLILVALCIPIFIISCAGQKPKPAREAAVAGPERKIDEPLKAERITQEEYANAELSMGNVGLLDAPKLPFDPAGKYTYRYDRDGVTIANQDFKFQESDGELVSANAVIDVTSQGWRDRGMVSEIFNKQLRPKEFMLRVGAMGSREMDIYAIDFTKEPFGIKTGGPKGDQVTSGFTPLDAPDGEVWPLNGGDAFNLSMITPLIDPTVPKAELWVVSLEGAMVSRLALQKGEEQQLTLSKDKSTHTVVKYTAQINSILLGSLYVEKGGKLLAVDLAEGVKVELETVV